MSTPNMTRKRSADEAFSDLLALPSFERNPDHNEGEKHFTEDNPLTIMINGHTPFTIHPALLTTSRNLTTKLAQADQKTQPLLIFGISVPNFRVYTSWLYCHNIQLPFQHEDDPAGQTTFWTHWRASYETGAKLQDTVFRNALIRLAISKTIEHDAQPHRLVETIYEHSEHGSVHRVLCRDLAIHTWRVWQIADVARLGVEAFKTDLFQDLVAVLRADGIGRVGVREFLRGREGAYDE